MLKSGNSVVAVVVTYNRKDLLRTTINCLLNQEGTCCDVMIINNASTDGTEEMINDEFLSESIVYYNTGVNLGGAGGFEFGVGKAVELGYDFVWIMDDDTWPNEDALSNLFEADRKLNGNWGFLSSVAYWTDGSICRMNIQKKSIFRHVGKKEYNTNISSIKMCSFVSLLVKSEVIYELGLPIGEYFIWTDDYEYTGRISKRFPCYMVSSSKVVHAMKMHTRVNFAQDTADRIDRYHYIYRNDVHCYKQYGLIGWLYIILKNIYTAINIILNSKENRHKKIFVIVKGMIEGLFFKPQIKFCSNNNDG